MAAPPTPSPAQGAWHYEGNVGSYARYTQGAATLDIAPAINRASIVTNAAPVNGVPGAQATAEDTTLVFSTAHGNAVTVGDAGNDTLTVSLTVTHGVLNLAQTAGLANLTGDGTGTVSFSGVMADINAALNGLAFHPTLNDNGAAQLTISTSDAEFTDTDQVAITINPVNDAPTNTPVALTAIVEDSGARLITQDELLVNASDVDSPTLTVVNLAIAAGSGSLHRQWRWHLELHAGTERRYGGDVQLCGDRRQPVGDWKCQPRHLASQRCADHFACNTGLDRRGQRPTTDHFGGVALQCQRRRRSGVDGDEPPGLRWHELPGGQRRRHLDVHRGRER
jgi:hypothetical protein